MTTHVSGFCEQTRKKGIASERTNGVAGEGKFGTGLVDGRGIRRCAHTPLSSHNTHTHTIFFFLDRFKPIPVSPPLFLPMEATRSDETTSKTAIMLVRSIPHTSFSSGADVGTARHRVSAFSVTQQFSFYRRPLILVTVAAYAHCAASKTVHIILESYPSSKLAMASSTVCPAVPLRITYVPTASTTAADRIPKGKGATFHTHIVLAVQFKSHMHTSLFLVVSTLVVCKAQLVEHHDPSVSLFPRKMWSTSHPYRTTLSLSQFTLKTKEGIFLCFHFRC